MEESDDELSSFDEFDEDDYTCLQTRQAIVDSSGKYNYYIIYQLLYFIIHRYSRLILKCKNVNVYFTKKGIVI